jgi:short subunit dehydrogenase-like uncharacterized protein
MDGICAIRPIVAVFGATGYTGRFVLKELLRRGIRPIAIARVPAALAVADFPESEIERRRASLDDPASLNQALHGSGAVINCAGPFVDTADAVASAALRAGAHYVDVAAEQVSVTRTLETFDEPARKAGVAVVPSMAYFGGLADLLVTAALGDWEAVESIDVMIGFDSWHPTQGTRNTIARKSVGNLTITGGRLAEGPSLPVEKRWTFAEPVGDQAVIQLPFAEVVLLARHVKTTQLRTFLTQVAVTEVLNPATPPPEAADSMGRSAQNFVLEVVVTRGGQRRKAIARGRDSYAITAPLACEAVERLLKGQFSSPGAHAPGEVFDAKAFLAALGPDYPVEIIGM